MSRVMPVPKEIFTKKVQLTVNAGETKTETVYVDKKLNGHTEIILGLSAGEQTVRSRPIPVPAPKTDKSAVDLRVPPPAK